MKYLNIFKSRTVWVIIVLFIINGIEGVKELLPANWLPLINGILGVAGIYFRVKPKQQF